MKKDFISLVSLSKKFDLPLVNVFEIDSSLKNILSQISILKNNEGLVVKYDIGDYSYFIKVKTEDYVKIHKMISTIIVDRNLVELIFLEKIDDVLPVLKNDKLRDAILKYENDFTINIENLATNILDFFNNSINLIPENIDQKEKKKIFATQFVVNKKEWSTFLYQLWEKEEKSLFQSLEIIKNYYLKNITNNKKFEEFRKLINQKPFSEYYSVDLEN